MKSYSNVFLLLLSTATFGAESLNNQHANQVQRPSRNDEMSQEIQMRSIGIIRTPYVKAKGTPIQGVFADEVQAWVELDSKYAKGLKDLDGFSHAILLYYFHKSKREDILGKPYLENEEHGIFAIRSPHRPNHIGLSTVRIKKIEKNRLYFTDVDILDGTPLLDIKPFVPQFDNRGDAVNGWIEKHFREGEPKRTKVK